MSELSCPSTFCPLIAPKGSPWTGAYKAKCPQHDDLDLGGCPWWSLACSNGGHHYEIDQIKLGDQRDTPKQFDCRFAFECSWQISAGEKLCPPRYAMSKGLNPKVCLF